MEVVAGTARVDDLDAYVAELAEIGERHGSLIQGVDARYVASREHLERAVELARRAHERGEGVADDLALEVLLYVAGTRQIERAFELGLNEGEMSAVIVIDGGDEAAAAAAVQDLVAPVTRHPEPDEELLAKWFDIGPAEREATDAELADLVLERVALLEVEK